jgi:peptidoglycan hydrolase-like protein with peptidoglycan-binding domain
MSEADTGTQEPSADEQSAQPNAPSSLTGGVAGTHSTRTRLPLAVAPTKEAGKNTLQLSLLPIACWKLEDLRFDFDSSFIKPEGREEFTALLELWKQHNRAPLSIFGHADPTGKDDYNKKLSGRRALAVQAVLVRDVDRWASLYDQPLGGDDWGVRSVQHMLTALGFDPGIVDGKLGPKTKAAVQNFQTSQGLSADGNPGTATRKALFGEYMDFLCRDAQDQRVTLTAENFLARGADPKMRGDVQGCSEFNLVVVLSKDEDQKLSAAAKKVERDVALLPNRRVMVFLFIPGAKADPARWPCPAAEDGPDACRAQFFADGDQRRSPADQRRIYADTHDTMACRFYDRMARRSPCEETRASLMLRLLNEDNDVIPNAVYRVTLASGEVRKGQTGEDGWLIEQNVATPEKVLVEWGYPPELGISDEERAKRWAYPGPFGYQLEVTLDAESLGDDEAQAEARLRNLGYSPERTLQENLTAFQRDYQVATATGVLDDETKAALREADDDGLSRQEFIEKHGGGS